MNESDIYKLQKMFDEGAELIFVFNKLQYNIYRFFSRLQFINVQSFLRLPNPHNGKLVSIMLVVKGKPSTINIIDWISECFSSRESKSNKKDLENYYPNIWATLC